MAVMHSLANIVAFDASSCMYRYRAPSFLSLVTRPITILKTPVVAQWGCIRGCVSNGEARKKRGLGRRKWGFSKGFCMGKEGFLGENRGKGYLEKKRFSYKGDSKSKNEDRGSWEIFQKG